jgi:hypothetical protein
MGEPPVRFAMGCGMGVNWAALMEDWHKMGGRDKDGRITGRIETVQEPARSQGGSVMPLRPCGGLGPTGQAPASGGPAASRIQEVHLAIERGSSKAALEKAKLLHKDLASEESKSVLIDAYLARIAAMSAKDLTEEAKALTDLVLSRFPEAADRLGGVQRNLAALTGDMAVLVTPLADPNLSPERRRECEQAIRHGLVDMQALATCSTLPEDHPLRTAAAAIARAFPAVTSAEADDTTVALPEVSHRSPLADWKHLIRAIQCLYRGQDEACRRFLASVNPDSAPGRVADPIRSILAESTAAQLTQAGHALVQRVLGPRVELRNALRVLDAAFAQGPSRELYRQIRQTTLVCERACPQILERLKQHISIKATMANCPAEPVIDALGGRTVHDAYFWRLFARAVEDFGDFSQACVLWDRFRNMAIQEGLFTATGQENAFLYLHMADLLKRIPPDHLLDAQEDCRYDLENLEGVYDDGELLPHSRKTLNSGDELDLYFLYPEQLYERAAALRSDANIYKEWFDYAQTADPRDLKPEEIAQKWASAFPQDARPLLHLAEAAEQRNAFDKALKYIQQAEELGGIDPKIRRARFHLLVAKTVRHLKQEKPRLAAKDIEQLDLLSQAKEKDRPAFVASLRWIVAMLENNRSEAERLHGQIQDSLGGPVAAAMLLLSAARQCQHVSAETNRLQMWLTAYKEEDIVAALVCVYPICVDVEIRTFLPAKWEPLLTKWFKRSDRDLDAKGLLTMAEAALTSGWQDVAYYASGYGLQRSGPEQARFLFLRGRSLPYTLDERRRECFAAATELAKRVRDMDLVIEIADTLRKDTGTWGGSDPFRSDWDDLDVMALEDKDLRRIIEDERRTKKCPKKPPRRFFDAGGSRTEDLCQCPDCRRARGETVGYGTSRRGRSRRKTRRAPAEDYLFDDLFEEEEYEEEPQARAKMPAIPPELLLLGEIIRLSGNKLPTSKKDLDRLLLQHPELAIKVAELLDRAQKEGVDPFSEFGPDDDPWGARGEFSRRPPGGPGRKRR